MVLFNTPTWDINSASETLNKKLFGRGTRKRKLLITKQVPEKKIKPHVQSSHSQLFTSEQEAQEKHNIFSVKKSGIVIPTSTIAHTTVLRGTGGSKRSKGLKVTCTSGLKETDTTNRPTISHTTLLQGTGGSKRSKGQKVTCTSGLKETDTTNTVSHTTLLQGTGGSKWSKRQKVKCTSGLKEINLTKNKNCTVSKLDKLRSLKTNITFKGKHICVEPSDGSSARAGGKTGPIKTNCHQLSLDVGTSTSKSRIKERKRSHRLATSVSNEEICKIIVVKDNGSKVGDTGSSSSQISNVSNRDKKKQKFKSPNNQLQANGHTLIQDIKAPTRRHPGTLRERMLRKLQASRFRYLNQQMYCSQGIESLEYFKTDPSAFQAYHRGYRQQVTRWPLNPLSTIINSLKKKSSELVIADFGCGDAQLARSLPNTVHSFDLIALSGDVTVCDMAHTPLSDSTVDMVVFCLSLMGTNLGDYLIEANRILKTGGIMKIAEVESRFEDVVSFIKALLKYGFSIIHKDLSHNLFYFMDFQKVNNIKKKKKSPLPPVSLKPCLYKKR